MKPLQYWCAYVLCLALVLAAMGWVSATILKLERFQSEAIRKAAFEEDVRLALWRMETALVPLLSRESARPYFVYSSFYPAERAYTKMFEEIGNRDVMVASPLLTEDAPNVILHFQVDPEGRITSPEVPSGKARDLSVATYGNGAMIEAASQGLAEIGSLMTLPRLLAFLPSNGVPAAPVPASLLVEQALPAAGEQQAANAPAVQVEEQQQEDETVQQVAANWAPQQQALRSDNEYNVRVQQQAKVQLNAPRNKVLEPPAPPKGLAPAKEPAPPVPPSLTALQEGVMTALWLDGKLLLARRVAVGAREYVQGCWLDWTAIRRDLLGEIRDLLAGAELVPVAAVATGARDAGGRMLAGLPVKLVPGPAPAGAAGGMTPVRLSLLIAWVCVLAGAGAVGVLLAGAVSLGERRGAFVSAVTHELRTPLTTFRMYTEMLAEGMVTDEAKRREYLATLNAEANRLTHLVENVLSYARLERGRAAGHLEDVAVASLLEQVKGRLEQRAEQTGLAMEVERVGDPGLAVRADVSVVEQILFNLVDNACKYATRDGEKRLHLEVAGRGGFVAIRVRDHGPGVDPDVLKRLFTPFSKSAKKAAETAPGVGLGLALSRRLARQMGGDLRLVSPGGDGACFELVLPRPG